MNYSSAFDAAPGGNTRSNGSTSGLDAFDNAKPFEPLPVGNYRARVVSGSIQQTRKGDEGYRIVFEVTEGEFLGGRVSRIWVFTDKAIGYAKRDLAAFGLTTSKQLREPFPATGCEVYCRLTVALQRGDNGDTFNDVKRFDDIHFVDSAAKPFLIDPDAKGSEGGAP